ncbi:MAG: response regulator transcription factor [Thermomicrobiales bacterium]
MTAVLPLILVVDDNPWFREFLEDLLSVEGYRVVAVEPGEALAAASAEPPALAVLDAVMPGMDGPSLCRQMREVDGTRDTPILFLTGLPEQALVTQLIDCDGWSYLSKPCTPEELLDAVQQQVARPGVSP